MRQRKSNRNAQAFTWTAVIACWAMIFAFVGTGLAANAVNGGSITGTVTKDGQPIANAKVLLFHPPARGAHAGKLGKSGATTAASQTGAAKRRPDPVAQTTTDKDGKFSLNDVPAGTYIVVAGERGEGRGHQRVIVTNGQSEAVTLTLEKRASDKGAGGERAGKGAN